MKMSRTNLASPPLPSTSPGPDPEPNGSHQPQVQRGPSTSAPRAASDPQRQDSDDDMDELMLRILVLGSRYIAMEDGDECHVLMKFVLQTGLQDTHRIAGLKVPFWIKPHATRLQKVELVAYNPEDEQRVLFDPIKKSYEIETLVGPEGSGGGISVKLGSYRRQVSFLREAGKIIQWKIEGTRQKPHFVLLNVDGAAIPSAYPILIKVKREGTEPRQPVKPDGDHEAEPFPLDLHFSYETQIYTFFGPFKKVKRWNPDGKGHAAGTVFSKFRPEVFQEPKYRDEYLGLLWAVRRLWGAPRQETAEDSASNGKVKS